MAEEDIYQSKRKYLTWIRNLDSLCERPAKTSKKIYYVKNKKNISYFKRLFLYFEANNLTYARRCRYIQMLTLICWVTKKNLKDCDRSDIDFIVATAHKRFKSLQTKEMFIKMLKRAWKVLFPEKDEKGRADERIVPYVVRHLNNKMERSIERARNDKLTWQEYLSLVTYFSDKPNVQAFITLATESLGRPQEILWRRLKDIELHENYAKIWVTDHGKEGANGFLQCIDSYPYLLKWLEVHPFRQNPDAFIFVNNDGKYRGSQLKPAWLWRLLKKSCQDLKIDKPVSSYSLKRNGVTFCRIRGESDVEIQHKARWTSTRQLKIYDMSTQNDVFNKQLSKRGLIADLSDGNKGIEEKQCKQCVCGQTCGLTDDLCSKCKRPLNRKYSMIAEQKKDEEINSLRLTVEKMNHQLNAVMQQMQNRAIDVLDNLEKEGVIKDT